MLWQHKVKAHRCPYVLLHHQCSDSGLQEKVVINWVALLRQTCLFIVEKHRQPEAAHTLHLPWAKALLAWGAQFCTPQVWLGPSSLGNTCLFPCLPRCIPRVSRVHCSKWENSGLHPDIGHMPACGDSPFTNTLLHEGNLFTGDCSSRCLQAWRGKTPIASLLSVSTASAPCCCWHRLQMEGEPPLGVPLHRTCRHAPGKSFAEDSPAQHRRHDIQWCPQTWLWTVISCAVTYHSTSDCAPQATYVSSLVPRVHRTLEGAQITIATPY